MQGSQFLTFVFLFAVSITMIILYSRYRERELEHKEKLAALEKGVDLPVRQTAPWTPRTYLLRGMIWLFTGLAATLVIHSVAYASNQPPSPEEQFNRNIVRTYVRRRLIQLNSHLATGVAVLPNDPPPPTLQELETLASSIPENHGIPVGLAYLGLIPIGVGLAYLIFYWVEARKLLS